MTISVVLTCYKQEKYIEQTILSVINQSFKDRELLVWDDSPDDNCRNIISKYVEKYPDKIRARHHNPNKWIVNNMQFLIEHRSKESEYIAFLEWDDCLFSEYLDEKIKVFDKNSNIKLVYNEVTTIDLEWKMIEEKQLKQYTVWFCKKWKISYNELISNMYYMSWSTLMVRSDIIDKYTFIPNFLWPQTIISDIYCFNKIAHNEDIYGIDKPLVYYRIQKNSVSNNINGVIKYDYELIEYYKFLLKQWYISDSTYKKRTHRLYLLICTASLKKCLNMWFFSTSKIFISESLHSIKMRVKWFHK